MVALPFHRQQWTPDEVRYLYLAQGRHGASPFVYRWLIPMVCRTSGQRWMVANAVGVAGIAIGTMLLALGLSSGRVICSALLVLALPSFRFNVTHYLVDLPAMGLATMAAGLAVQGWWIPAVLVSIVSGACKETAPVFAALFAWNPLLLLGMASPLIARLVIQPGHDVLDARNADILAHPLRYGIAFHHDLLSPVYIAPWGAVITGLAHPSWQLLTVMVIAYGQLLIATDTVRLYQWAAPILAISAVQTVPTSWLPVLLVITIWNPLAGDGV